MKLHFATNTISVAVAIALEEAKLPYEGVPVSFRDAEQTKPAYLKVNPHGRVPTLIDGDHVLTETGALLEYIAAKAPQSGLMPSDPLKAVRVREAMFYLASTMHVNHAHRMRGHRWADREESWADMAAKVPETMTRAAHHVEERMLSGPYILGSDFTIGDAYLFAVCTWLEGDGVDLAEFPKIRAFMAATDARASVTAVRAAGILKP